MDSASIHSTAPLLPTDPLRSHPSIHSHGIGGSGNYRAVQCRSSCKSNSEQHNTAARNTKSQYGTGMVIINIPSCSIHQHPSETSYLSRSMESYSTGIGGAGNFMDPSLHYNQQFERAEQPRRSGADRLLGGINKIFNKPQ